MEGIALQGHDQTDFPTGSKNEPPYKNDSNNNKSKKTNVSDKKSKNPCPL
jgi:hypothetical protein